MRPFHAPQPAPAALLAADDRAHRDSDRADDFTHVVMRPGAARKSDRRRALEMLAPSRDGAKMEG